jgi:hypothetical protein
MTMSIASTGMRAFDTRRAELRAAEADAERAHVDERRAEQRSEDADRKVDRAQRASNRRIDRYA